MSAAPIELHIHGDVHVHLPPSGDIPLPLFNQLKELITMNNDEITAALDAANAKLQSIGAQLDKGINEVIVAISQAGSAVPQTVVDAVNRLKSTVDAIGTKAQTLDDLNPDAPPPAP